ncbi:2-oxoglutarate-dependent dioxygenase 11-like isoform X2 [Phragmites australis]|uniref:2-oxoglutarate-dependent dioxygenase 11-like isoform X2 n=1 Tax=Phragmites australis TaxID=29695 RepID=UPI002D794B71|nr:2-oxoglutarate-dependent dioxygenase 11-like isoform X2 [Phragmites australis]
MAHAKTGTSLPVPNVQALAQTWNGSGEQVPERYVRTEEVSAKEVVAGCAIPVVDLSRLLDPRSFEEELANLGSACQHWGFFQLINHGVPDEAIQDVRRDIAEFFKLPLEAKKVYAQVPESGLEGYGQAFVVSETQKLDWSDMIYLMVRPAESRDMRFWPAQPPSFRSSVDRYSAEAANVVSCLLRFMAVEMGVEPERLLEMFGGLPQAMRVSYYPSCMRAGEVLGLSPHTDACGLTLLLHVNDVQGLQVRRDDGRWLAVDPLDGAFLVNVGDILEILSNGRYRSVEHRAVVHPDKERISAAMFHQPCRDTTVGPLPELVKDGGVARYKSVSHADFMKRFFSKKLDGRRNHLDYYKI